MVDGSTERRARASASRPAHFISSVRRTQRRYSTSAVRSSPNVGPFSRGSSLRSINMSARRVVAMAAIMGLLPDRSPAFIVVRRRSPCPQERPFWYSLIPLISRS